MNDRMYGSSGLFAAYAGDPAGPRYQAWREEICRGFCRLDVEPSEGSHIDCKVEISQVSSLALARGSGTSGRFLRSRDLLSDSCDDLVLVGATSGRVLVVQEGRSIELQASQMCLTDMTVECAVAINTGNDFITIRMPRRELLSICPYAESRLSKPHVGNSPISGVITRYFALSAETAASLDAIGQKLTARHMVDLVALLLRTGQDETELAMQRGYSAARLKLIQAQVLENLDNASLTIASIARHSGLTPKQVQRLFERAGTTFTDFVLEQRLLLARRLLSGPSNRKNKISTVAYTAGFGDLSYFHRAFRRRFGGTPAEWRDASDKI